MTKENAKKKKKTDLNYGERKTKKKKVEEKRNRSVVCPTYKRTRARTAGMYMPCCLK